MTTRKGAKSRRSQLHRLTRTFRYRGKVDDEARPYVAIRRGDSEPSSAPLCVIPLVDCGDLDRFNAHLLAGGIVLPTTEDRKAAMREASKETNFDSAIVAPHPGFNGDFYALPSGKVVARRKTKPTMVDGEPVDTVKPLIGFDRDDRRNRKNGSLKRYREQLGTLLQGQDLLTFGLCMSLAPLLLKWSGLDESFGFQLCGAAGSGKTLVTLIAASAWGNPYDQSEMRDTRYLEYLGWDRKLDKCSDQPLLLDGLDRLFALESARQKLEHVRKLDDTFHHSLSQLGGSASRRARILLWSTSQEPVEALCGDDDKAAARLQGRLLTIPVPEHRKGKVIAPATLLEGVGASTLSDQIKDVIRGNHGRSAVRMIRKLLEASHDETRLKADVRELMQEFVARCAVGNDDGLALRAARRFALVAAAGQLARRYGAMPKELDTDTAVMACYLIFRSSPNAPSFEDRLRALMIDEGVVDLGRGKLPEVSKGVRKSAKVYVRPKKSGIIWIYIRAEHIYDVFPDWKILASKGEVKAHLLVEDEDRNGGRHRHLQVKRRLGAGRPQERVFCFQISKQ